ncbi:MAG: substrate-binding domain-containing protein [Anaerolineae bacterium]
MMSRFIHSFIAFGLVTALLVAGCTAAPAPSTASQPATNSAPQVLRLATTTSTYDSGLLDAILPQFEAEFNAQVDVVAVGTGQALAIGARGDADVVLVHARAREDQFVADGHAPARYDVMYNDFVIVGPPDDMAGIRSVPTAAEAFEKIANAGATFASRGDDSGTHTKERGIWAKAGIEPGPDDGWYNSLGQGMGNTLIFANEQRAYTLTDRGTFLSMKNQLPKLTILVGGDSIANNPDPMLYNPYGVMPINPAKHPGVNYDLAMKFVEWLTSASVQQQIAKFGIARFGQSLFYPNSVISNQ